MVVSFQPVPARPGLVVRTLGRFVPGVRRTGEQIEDYAAQWHDRNVAALESGLPLMVAIGDSLAQGIGASSVDAGYVGRIAQHFSGRLAVVNLSRSGARIGDVLDAQLGVLGSLDVEPALVTCSVGSNDLLRGANPAVPRRAMRKLVAELPDSTIIATLPDVGSPMARRLNGVLRASAALRGLPLADVSAEMQGWRGKMAPDGFHPNDAGYDSWVAAFLPVIIRRVQEPPQTG